LVTFDANTTYTLASIAYNITTDVGGASGLFGTSVLVTATTAGITITDNTGDLGNLSTLAVSGSAANLASLGLSATTVTGTEASIAIDGGAAQSLTQAQNVSGTVVDYAVNGATLAVTLNGALSTTTFLGTANYGNYADLNKVNFSVTSSTAISTVTNAIETVSAMRGTLGAYQNELQHVSDNESVMIQNLQASNAQIADTNMASEMVTFTQDQVLVQAGVSMLAQANQIPQMVLKLIG
jgi:flagellin